MKKRLSLILAATALACTAIVSVTGCGALFDKIADTVLANAVFIHWHRES